MASAESQGETDTAQALMATKEWRPYPGPQTEFLACPAYEVMYGGEAGGGKSECGIAGAARLVHHPNYRALILRRTFKDLKRSLIPRAYKIYPSLGGKYNMSDKEWHFPSGAIIEFGHMEHESNKLDYNSAEYQYIFLDELTHFEESMYLYMMSRLRSSAGLPIRIRSGTNPGGPGHDWVLNRWAPWLDRRPEYTGPRAAPGQRMYFKLDPVQDKEVWCAKDDPDALCRVFFPAGVKDNPAILSNDPNYQKRLDSLDPVTRAQLKHGNWLIKPAAGLYFKRAWFEIVAAAPATVLSRVRYWDRAASPTGDWTAGALMSRTSNGQVYIEDIVRFRGTPSEVISVIKQTAKMDAPETRLVLELDPGQAGKFEAEFYTRELAGHNVRCVPPQGDKVTRAQPVSAQAEAGNIRLVSGAWNQALIEELEGFPEGKYDDQVDALSGAYRQLLTGYSAYAISAGKREFAREAGGF